MWAVWLCLALLVPRWVQAGSSVRGTRSDVVDVDVVNLLFPPDLHPVLRHGRAPQRPAYPLPKRAQQGTRFALSLDVPTSILSVLIDLAKNQDMRTKAAANAELMARVG
ncbi:hypothetical protein NHX12_030114 [Muraenolepis orangiensis]|uniref:Corticotropin-releasing factor domain-containing protein n=1 Tax=Muraenolepis orangiensis TaxID=630683 RepID=A0A9Q0EAM9_9TELE|nr:hypothetical protein NHX12_030114 [Muraenolepis orangiensis]